MYCVCIFCRCFPLQRKSSNSSSEKYTSKMSQVASKTKDLDKPLTYTCDICGQDGFSEEDMKSHMRIQHVEDEITCPFCDLRGVTLEEMNMHVNVSHLDTLSFGQTESPIKGQESMEAEISSDIDYGDLTTATMSATEKDSNITDSAANTSISSSEINDSKQTNGNTSSSSPVVRVTAGLDSDSKQTNKSSDTKGSPKVIEQAAKRAKLHLDVPFSTPHTSSLKNKHHERQRAMSDSIEDSEACASTSSASTFTCPFCPWNTTSPNEINYHVNVKHSEILSPAKPMSDRDRPGTSLGESSRGSSDGDQQCVCPICGVPETDVHSLEVHINTEHIDETSTDDFSPLDDVSPSVSSQGYGSDGGLCCPVCDMAFDGTDSLQIHVEGHFSTGHTPGMNT